MSQPNVTATVEGMRNHWWWRPGWRVGRRFYTWHYTFEGVDELHELVGTYQEQLKDFPTLDPIPIRWLHITIQGLGFVDELNPKDLTRIQAAVDARLGVLPPTEVTFGPVLVKREAIALPPNPTEPILEVRRAIRSGIADVWGINAVPESMDKCQPHLSIMYSNGDVPSAEVISALTSRSVDPVSTAMKPPRLIRLHRDNGMYEWP